MDVQYAKVAKCFEHSKGTCGIAGGASSVKRTALDPAVDEPQPQQAFQLSLPSRSSAVAASEPDPVASNEDGLFSGLDMAVGGEDETPYLSPATLEGSASASGPITAHTLQTSTVSRTNSASNEAEALRKQSSSNSTNWLPPTAGCHPHTLPSQLLPMLSHHGSDISDCFIYVLPVIRPCAADERVASEQ